jgi:hypothetical protein
MRLPRCSIADVMALTALVALDCLAWRDGYAPPFTLLRLLLLPSLNVLIVATYLLMRGIRWRALAHFMAGFVVVGWLSMLWFVYENRELVADALRPAKTLPPAEFEIMLFGEPEWVIASSSLLQLVPACAIVLIYLACRGWRERRGRMAVKKSSREA